MDRIEVDELIDATVAESQWRFLLRTAPLIAQLDQVQAELRGEDEWQMPPCERYEP